MSFEATGKFANRFLFDKKPDAHQQPSIRETTDMSDESRSKNQAESLQRKMDQAETKMYRIDRAHTEKPIAERSADPESGANAPAETVNASATSPIDSAPVDSVSADQAVEYDFRQQTPVSREQLSSLHTLHERCAEDFSESASDLMRTALSCELTEVVETSYCEFLYSLDDPTCFYLIAPQTCAGQWMLDVSPRLAFAMIDRMLGGEPNPAETIHREMTDIEARLMRRVVDRFLQDLASSWKKIAAIDPIISEPVVRHPMHGRYLAANERTARVNFTATVSGVSGAISLLIPLATIDHLGSQLNNHSWCDAATQPTDQTRSAISNQLAAAPIEVIVNLAHSTIRTDDLLGLSVGDIIATEKESTDDLELSIQSVPKFKASAGAFRGKKAVRIESNLDKPETEVHAMQKLDSDLESTPERDAASGDRV